MHFLRLATALCRTKSWGAERSVEIVSHRNGESIQYDFWPRRVWRWGMGEDVRACGHGEHTWGSRGTETGKYNRVSFLSRRRHFELHFQSLIVLESRGCRFRPGFLYGGWKLINDRLWLTWTLIWATFSILRDKVLEFTSLPPRKDWECIPKRQEEYFRKRKRMLEGY